MAPHRYRVLMVEDDPDHRQILTHALSHSDRYELVGWTDTASGAVDAAERLRPDIVLLDLLLRASTGYESIPQLLVIAPDCMIVAISSLDHHSSRRLALAAGAFAFLHKFQTLYRPDELAQSLDILTQRFRHMLAGDDMYAPLTVEDRACG